MKEESSEDEMIEILDLDSDFLDGYISDETEGEFNRIICVDKTKKNNFPLLPLAQLTEFYEFEDIVEDSFFKGLDETTVTEYCCPLCKELFIGRNQIKVHVRRYFKYVWFLLT